MKTNNTQKPTVLVTNDDGIQSHFLWALVDALGLHFDVSVVAPDGERSWAGRSFSRMMPITVEPDTSRERTWATSGSPTDCVNLGMFHLMESPPDIVVSGINLGFNMSLPLVLTSGTVSAALEAALSGVPAVAASMHIPFDEFEAVKATNGRVEGSLARALQQSAKATADYARSLLDSPIEGTVVHNLNFPANMSETTPLETVTLSNIRLGSMYEPSHEGTFEFRFPSKREPIHVPDNSDLSALERQHACVTLLDYDRLGRN